MCLLTHLVLKNVYVPFGLNIFYLYTLYIEQHIKTYLLETANNIFSIFYMDRVVEF